MEFPTYLYHKTQAPEGLLVRSAEQLPTGSGWVDTPAKFDPNYKEPPPPSVAPGTIPLDAARRGYIPQLYPSVRYGKNGEECLVRSAAEDEALDRRVWADSPAAWAVPERPAPVTPPAPATTGPTDPQKQELWNATVKEVAEKVAQIPDARFLMTLRQVESENPKGARKGVLEAIDLRVLALSVPASDQE